MTYPLLNVFLTMMWLFLWILWIFLLVRVITDIFRSSDLSGGAKAGWLALTVLLPFLGVFAYLIVRGGTMTDREVRREQQQEQAFRALARKEAHDGGSADDLSKLADLRDRGIITEDEFQRGKEKALSRPGG